jgi:hypothetical protein
MVTHGHELGLFAIKKADEYFKCVVAETGRVIFSIVDEYKPLSKI